MSNMTRQPEPILRRVKCSERLPSESDMYFTQVGYIFFDERKNSFDKPSAPEYWYEPLTAVVLTVEEYNELNEKARKYEELGGQ